MATKKKAPAKKTSTKAKSTTKASSSSRIPSDAMGMLDYYLVKKAPISLPATAKEWTVRFGPWILTALLALFIPIILGALGFGFAFLPIGAWDYPQLAAGAGFTFITFMLQIVLMFAALPGLFARKMQGWNLVFALVLLNTFFGLVNLHPVSALLSLVLGTYVLFQVRSYYK